MTFRCVEYRMLQWNCFKNFHFSSQSRSCKPSRAQHQLHQPFSCLGTTSKWSRERHFDGLQSNVQETWRVSRQQTKHQHKTGFHWTRWIREVHSLRGECFGVHSYRGWTSSQRNCVYRSGWWEENLNEFCIHTYYNGAFFLDVKAAMLVSQNNRCLVSFFA